MRRLEDTALGESDRREGNQEHNHIGKILNKVQNEER
jgi:hypothetical protein